MTEMLVDDHYFPTYGTTQVISSLITTTNGKHSYKFKKGRKQQHNIVRTNIKYMQLASDRVCVQEFLVYRILANSQVKWMLGYITIKFFDDELIEKQN